MHAELIDLCGRGYYNFHVATPGKAISHSTEFVLRIDKPDFNGSVWDNDTPWTPIYSDSNLW